MHLSPLSRVVRPVRVLAAAAFAFVLVPLAHCNDNEPAAPPATTTIGPSGGALASSDYVFEILVPPGALSTDVVFTITPVNTPGSAPTAAPSYSITPAGQTFAAPVVISFSEQGIAFDATHDLSDYRVAAFAANAWAPLANPTVDTLAGTIEGTATAVSGAAYSVIVPTGGSCVTVNEQCSAGDDAGAGASTPGCTATCDVSFPPTLPGKCAAYAGAVSGACSTDGGTSLTVSCCYPTGAPICFTELEPNGCTTPCLQFPGSTATSCVPDVGPPLDNTLTGGLPQSTCCFAPSAPICMASHVTGHPAPRCETSGTAACAAYPGTSVTSCSDVSDGMEATCCLPVGTLPGTLPPPSAASGTGGVVAPVGDGGENADASGNGDASGATDANGNGDANEGTDAGKDSGPTDAGDDGG